MSVMVGNYIVESSLSALSSPSMIVRGKTDGFWLDDESILWLEGQPAGLAFVAVSFLSLS